MDACARMENNRVVALLSKFGFPMEISSIWWIFKNIRIYEILEIYKKRWIYEKYHLYYIGAEGVKL